MDGGRTTTQKYFVWQKEQSYIEKTSGLLKAFDDCEVSLRIWLINLQRNKLQVKKEKKKLLMFNSDKLLLLLLATHTWYFPGPILAHDNDIHHKPFKNPTW